MQKLLLRQYLCLEEFKRSFLWSFWKLSLSILFSKWCWFLNQKPLSARCDQFMLKTVHGASNLIEIRFCPWIFLKTNWDHAAPNILILRLFGQLVWERVFCLQPEEAKLLFLCWLLFVCPLFDCYPFAFLVCSPVNFLPLFSYLWSSHPEKLRAG